MAPEVRPENVYPSSLENPVAIQRASRAVEAKYIVAPGLVPAAADGGEAGAPVGRLHPVGVDRYRGRAAVVAVVDRREGPVAADRRELHGRVGVRAGPVAEGTAPSRGGTEPMDWLMVAGKVTAVDLVATVVPAESRRAIG